MPREAPHAAIWLRTRHERNGPRIRSTLDGGIQAQTQEIAQLHAADLRRRKIYGGAIVVVDHRTREVRALVGSLDFDDKEHGGQIPMFDRRRSPGSTLKPLLYALAIDRGLALPGFLVPDVPMLYGTYRPRNFDNKFSGLVTLEDALSRSLNIPFVELLRQLGVETFLGELARLGVTNARAEPGYFGLSLIVGSIELTPLELASMYATIAQDGVYVPLRLVERPQPPGTSIFGTGAAHLARDALAIKDRPDFPRRRDLTKLPPAIHWKTGTSFGFRDAWAIGSGPTYTAVVWTGNTNNKASADLVGSEAAGPVLFDVLESLADRRAPSPAPTAPDDLVHVEVCAYSGHVPTHACDHRVTVLAPQRAVPTTPCPYHQSYEVDVETSHAVLPACRTDGRVYARKSFTVLPSSVTAWLAAQERAIPEGPVFADGCTPDIGGGPPIISSPPEGQVVTLIPGMPADNQRVPLAASTRAATLSWFVDGAHVGTAPSNERVYWTPTVGEHDIVVADERGRKGRRTIEVKPRLPGT
jgi:penicillin-binding protein 1C